MFKLFMFASVFATGYALAILDKNCTDNLETFLPSATVCADVYSEDTCKLLFPDAPAPATDQRPPNCYTDGTNPSEELKAVAIANCPKRCSYCCQTPEYSCDNAAFPRLTCATITSAQCKDMNLREIIAADCPSACGFCKMNGCVDASPSCEVAFCTTIGMENFVSKFCKRTCQMCDATTPNTSVVTAAPGVVTACNLPADNPNCASWVARGFCTNSFYSAAQRRQHCPRACNLC